MAPLRGLTPTADAKAPSQAGLPVSVNIFGIPFGDDPLVRQAASPVHHVRAGLPPFLLLSAEKDLPILPGMAEEMHRALLKKGVASRLLKIENRNHNSILFKAIQADDPAAHALVEFVQKTVAQKRKAMDNAHDRD